MASIQSLKSGAKLKIALDKVGVKDTDFSMMSTFHKNIDESAFLCSIPMGNGGAVVIDEAQKLLFRFGTGENEMIIAGYVDDTVKEGIRRYWKVRRVEQQRQFFQRADERIKVSLPVTYMEETWTPNYDGIIEKEEGLTLDISAGGAAIYCNRHFDVGEVIEFDLPRIGTSDAGKPIEGIVAAVCWAREAPKGSAFRFLAGIQFRFGEDGGERQIVKDYTAFVKKKYKA